MARWGHRSRIRRGLVGWFVRSGQVAWRERKVPKTVVFLWIMGQGWKSPTGRDRNWIYEKFRGKCLFCGGFISISFSERWDRGLYTNSCTFAAKQSQGNWESSEQSNTSRAVFFGWCSAFRYGNDSCVPCPFYEFPLLCHLGPKLCICEKAWTLFGGAAALVPFQLARSPATIEGAEGREKQIKALRWNFLKSNFSQIYTPWN